MAKLSPFQAGELVVWRDEKGFGFIRPFVGNKDLFIHISAFKRGMSRRPQIGDVLHYRIETDASGRERVRHASIEGMQYAAPRFGPIQVKPLQQSPYINGVIGLPFLLSTWMLWSVGNPIPLFMYVFISAITLFLYGLDKRSSIVGQWRIPEVYLHLFALLGGWPGALIAQREYRHKLKKSRFQTIFRGIIILHGVIWAIAIGFGFSARRMAEVLLP
ncbi:MAG: cold shock and DUF1294 domain-containing protein [Methylococcus sp.]|nr:cold shock and DUF1294 domain-containing protein [Methylococcus sp.]